MEIKHTRNFKDFSGTFTSDVVKDWAQQLEEWHANPGKGKDPYEDERTSKSF